MRRMAMDLMAALNRCRFPLVCLIGEKTVSPNAPKGAEAWVHDGKARAQEASGLPGGGAAYPFEIKVLRAADGGVGARSEAQPVA